MIREPEEAPTGPVLRTDRLLLQALTPDELEAIAEGTHLCQFAPEFPTPPDRDFAAAALDAGSHLFTETMYSLLAVVDLASGQIIGVTGFVGPPIDGELEIVGSVVPSRQRQGYAAEVLPHLVELAFQNPRVTAVQAAVPEGDEPPQKLLLRHGFVQRESCGSELEFVYPRPEHP